MFNETIEDPIRSELLSLLALVLKYYHYQSLNRLVLRFSPDDHGALVRFTRPI